MTVTIDDLLKKPATPTAINAAGAKPAHSSPSADNSNLAPNETQEQLNEKMTQMTRRNKELETLQQARDLGVGYLSLEGIKIEPDVLRLISEPEAKNKKVICFHYVPFQEIRIATLSPQDLQIQEIKDRLSHDHHTPVNVYQISEDSYQEAFALYGTLPKIREVLTKVEITNEEMDKFSDINNLAELEKTLATVNVSEILSLVISAAIKFEASDIHIESSETSVDIRYRIDGILQDVSKLKPEFYKKLTSRIKLLSKLKINVTSIPQDGHFVITKPEGKIDVRVSTLPTNYGESIVMRILRSDISHLKVSSLGLGRHNLAILTKEIKKPNGLLVVTGPTGSGKTTTLYSLLSDVNNSEIKVLTIEDPIEYEVQGINQSQVNPKAGYTFASGLRSLVRQDPDVILVGEMRDSETVEIGINAALTGHLVLSTLHTNDAAGALPRFLSMDAKPYLLAPALNAVVAQRLVRILCQDCKEETTLAPELQTKVDELIAKLPDKMKSELPVEKKYYTSKGCEVCFGFGFKGRIGVFEIFTMTSRLQDIVMAGATSAVALEKLLAEEGMVTMAQDGILKALAGTTSVEEVFRVVQEK